MESPFFVVRRFYFYSIEAETVTRALRKNLSLATSSFGLGVTVGLS